MPLAFSLWVTFFLLSAHICVLFIMIYFLYMKGEKKKKGKVEVPRAKHNSP